MKSVKLLILFDLLLSASLSALTAFPMTVTVQTGDTLKFPPIIHGWDSTAVTMRVDLSMPRHGKVMSFASFFDSTPNFILMDTISTYSLTPKKRDQTPRSFPGLTYIPDAGFSGIDSFTYKITTTKDSTRTTLCEVRIVLPEPSGMTVLLVVNQALLPSIDSSVKRLKADLESEGYTAKVIPFPNMPVSNAANAKILWDTLKQYYSLPSPLTAGAILIGKLPYYAPRVTHESAFWGMSLWQGDVDRDTALVGYRVGNWMGGYCGSWHMSGAINLWVSRIWGTDGAGNPLPCGDEETLVKRMLQSNHDYRTGISRLPGTAFSYVDLVSSRNDANVYLSIWSKAQVRKSTDAAHPFNKEFRQGGEVFEVATDGNTDAYCRTFEGLKTYTYTKSSVMNTHVPIRVLLSNSCHTGGFGNLVNRHVLAPNSGCILAVGPTDYQMGVGAGIQYGLSDTLKSRPQHQRFQRYLKNGTRWGRSWLRSNNSIHSTIIYGDLSLKPNMTLPNAMPSNVSILATKTGPLSWNFAASATDADDGIAGYELFANGYHYGLGKPDSSSRSGSFSFIYASARLCTLRVEVFDHYKARNYGEVIIKTDSGVVPYAPAEAVPPQAMSPALNVFQNPFTPAARAVVRLSARAHITLDVIRVNGARIAALVSGSMSSGEHCFSWQGIDANGRPMAAGTYFLRLRVGNQYILRKIVLVR